MESVTDHVCTAVRQRILRGDYASGLFLREDTLAKSLGVSITPVQEALRRLSVDGWLESIPYRGFRVFNWTQEDIQDTFEVRALLESQAARRAASRIRPPQLRRMAEIVAEEQAMFEDIKATHCEQTPPNIEFHEIIMAAAGSRRLQRALEAALRGAGYIRSTHGLSHAAIEKAIKDHSAIQAALAAADADLAEALMYDHIISVVRSLPESEPGANAKSVTTPSADNY